MRDGVSLTIVGSGIIPSGANEGSHTNDVVVWVDMFPCLNVTVANVTTETVLCTITDYTTGYYPVCVFVKEKGFASVTGSASSYDITPNLVVYLEANATAIVPTSGSLAGGTLISLTGTGISHIPREVGVTLGGVPCNVTESSLTKIVCITGATSSTSTHQVVVTITVNGYIVANSLQYIYDSDLTPRITAINGGEALFPEDSIKILGNGFANDTSEIQVYVVPDGQMYSMEETSSCAITVANVTSIVCTVPSQSAGSYDVRVHIVGVGLSWGDATINYLMQISSLSPHSSGYGGGVLLKLFGNGFPAIFPMNDVKTDSLIEAATILVTVCEVECIVLESSLTELKCVLGPYYKENFLLNDTYCPVTISYSNVEAVAPHEYRFSAEETPTLESIIPTVGGTAGGTITTIHGTGLLPPLSTPNFLLEHEIIVTIDGAVCEWYSRNTLPSDTSIECRTSEHQTTLKGVVTVYVEGKGFALTTGEGLFEYVDRWSSTFTWGGAPLPKEGDSVHIRAGQTVFLDIDTPVLNLILIEGSLIFEDEQDLHLQAKYIFINYGALQVQLLI